MIKEGQVYRKKSFDGESIIYTIRNSHFPETIELIDPLNNMFPDKVAFFTGNKFNYMPTDLLLELYILDSIETFKNLVKKEKSKYE